MKRRSQNQQGAAHLVIIIIIVIVIIAALGFAAWRVMVNNSPEGKKKVAEDNAKQIALSECAKENDQNICRFYTSWKVDQKYKITSTDPSGSTSIFEIDGDKSHMTITGEMAYDVITIGKTTYTKSGDVWYKQTAEDPTNTAVTDIKPTFQDPNTDTTQTTENKTAYNSLGKEACGKLTCFKYEIIDPASPDIKQYIWFDDKDYQMQKSQTVTADGTSEQVFAYDNISITAPSPVTELGPNQYIVPGQTEPLTMPDVSNLQQQ